MREKNITFQGVIKAVCDEMGYTPEELSTPRAKSEVKMSIAKIIATHLLKTCNLGSNNEIKRALGYTGAGTKTIRSNKAAMRRAIELNDELVIPHLNNIYAVLNGGRYSRLYTRNELPELRVCIVEDEIISKCKAQNVFPFVIRTSNQLFYGYGVDNATGAYIGQNEQEYKVAVM